MTFNVLVSVAVFVIVLCYSRAENIGDGIGRTIILHGIEAKSGQFPYVVFITIQGRTNTDRSQVTVCSGSIVSPTWVMTAYHCFTHFLNTDNNIDFDKVNITILAGSIDRKAKSSHDQRRRGIKSVLMPKNPNFTISSTFNYDLAIIQVEIAFDIDFYVKPIHVAKSPLVYDRERKCKVLGFGHTALPPSGDTPINNTKLHYTYMRLAPNEKECARLALSTGHLPASNWDGSQLCLHPIKWDSAPCNGDSGGPVVCNGLLLGVGSGRENISPENIYPHCGREGNYHIYAYAGMHEKWFRKYIDDLPEFLPLDNRGEYRSRRNYTDGSAKTNYFCLRTYLIFQLWAALFTF